jgi:hypothetical protein
LLGKGQLLTLPNSQKRQGISGWGPENKKAAVKRLFCRHADRSACSSAKKNYFFSSAAGASAFGASAAGASALGASAAGASALGASAGAGGAASSFLPQAANASASREAISNDFFMVILQVKIKNDSKSERNNYR